MTRDDRGSRLLEGFKALSTFGSTVVLSAVVALLTNQYNNKQLEIARINEISSLIPKLGSKDENERKFSAIALGLYGKDAIPALVALLDDPNGEVRLASVTSLELIGDDAVARLHAMFSDKRNSGNVRSSALYALGAMKAPIAYALARQALTDKQEDWVVRKDAANALGYLQDAQSARALAEVLDRVNGNDVQFSLAIVWALGQIRDPGTAASLTRLLSHDNEDLRAATVWALALIHPPDAAQTLSAVGANDPSPKVKEAAAGAVDWVRRSQP